MRVYGASGVGLARLLGAVVRGNLLRHPERARLLDGEPGVVRLVAADPPATVTCELRDGTLRIYSGAVAPPDVVVSGPAAAIVESVAVPDVAGVPSPLHPAGRRALGRVLLRRVRVRGALRRRRLVRRVRGLVTTP